MLTEPAGIPTGGLSTRCADEVCGMKDRAQYPTCLQVRLGNRILFVRVENIHWIQAEGNYLRIHQGERSYLMRDTLTAMEKRLDPQCFFRVNRSIIINRECIRELRTCGRDYEVVMCSEDVWRWGRRFKHNLKRLLAADWFRGM